MKKIPLRGKYGVGKFTIVDDEDFEALVKWKWSVTGSGYVTGSIKDTATGMYKPVLMHRLLLKTPDGMEGDHINNNKFDNRKANLRNCTPAQNMMNRGLSSLNTTGFKGVSWDKERGKWAVRMRINGRMTHIGRFEDIQEAIDAYKNKVKELHGEFANEEVMR